MSSQPRDSPAGSPMRGPAYPSRQTPPQRTPPQQAPRAAPGNGPGYPAAPPRYTVNGRTYQSWEQIPEADRSRVMMPGVDPGPDGKVGFGDFLASALMPKVKTYSSRRGADGMVRRTTTVYTPLGRSRVSTTRRGGPGAGLGLIIGLGTAGIALLGALVVVVVLLLT